MTDTNQKVRETPELLPSKLRDRADTLDRKYGAANAPEVGLMREAAAFIHANADNIAIGEDLVRSIDAAASEYPWLRDWTPAERYGEIVGDLLELAFPVSPPAVPDAVGVRATRLTWNGNDAATAFGNYRVQRTPDGYEVAFASEEIAHIGFGTVDVFYGARRKAQDYAQADFDRRILSSIEPTPSPEPQASNAGAVEALREAALLTVKDAAYHLAKYRPHCLEALRAALSTPEPQTGERDGEESPYTWVKTQRVPGTSYVGGSVMLLAEDGHCVGTVKVMMGEGATEIDVYRALQTAGNPAKLQRFIRAARNGEQEANDRAEAAERRLAEVERAERARLFDLFERDPEQFTALCASDAALRAKPEAQAIVGKEAGE